MPQVKNPNQFIYYWYKVFKWREDPFAKKNLESTSQYISGYIDERKKINYFIIEKQSLCVITGEEGSGKTTLLKWLGSELLRYKDRLMVEFIDSNLQPNELISILIKPLLTFKEKAARSSGILKLGNIIKDKNLKEIIEAVNSKDKELNLKTLVDFIDARINNNHLVVLIDDFDKMSEKNSKLIQYLAKSDTNIQIILTSEKDNFDGFAKKRDWVFIKLLGIKNNYIPELVAKRISLVGGMGFDPFDKDELLKLYSKANMNITEFLKLCRKSAVKKALDTFNSEESNVEKNIPLDEVEEVKESKPYEIKVVDNVQNKSSSIKLEKTDINTFTPIKIQKSERNYEKIKDK